MDSSQSKPVLARHASHTDLIAKLEGLTDGLPQGPVRHALADEITMAVGGAFPRPIWGLSYAALGSHLEALGAAVAIAETVLAGKIGPICVCIAGSAQVTIEQNDPCGWAVQAFGRTPPLAVLIATLRALEAAPQEPADDAMERRDGSAPGGPQ